MSLLKDPNARLEWPFRTIFRLFRKVIVETQFRRKVRTSWKLWLCKIKRKCRKFNILVAKNIFVALPILSFHFTFVSPTIGTFEQKVCAKWRQGCRRFLTKILQKTTRIEFTTWSIVIQMRWQVTFTGSHCNLWTIFRTHPELLSFIPVTDLDIYVKLISNVCKFSIVC